MAGKAATLVVRIVTDATNAQKGLDQTAGKVGKFRSGMQKATGPALAVVGAIAGLAAVTGRAASDLQQAEGAVESVFGDSAGTVKAWGQDAAKSVGLAATEYDNLASVVGSQLKAAGTATDQLAPKTKDLIGLGADLAATFGGSTADAVEAVGSLLRGERDPIEKYGVSIKQADIAAREAADGTDKLTGSAKKQADAAATLAILTDQTADAHGQFAREADTAAGAQARSTAEMGNASAELGQALLPAMATFSTILAAVAGFIADNSKIIVPLIAILGGLAIAVLAVNAALAVTAAVTAVLASPVLLIGIAVLALIAAVVLLYKKCAVFRAIVDAAFRVALTVIKAVWSWVKSNWPLLLAILTGPIGLAVLLITRNFDKIKAAFRTITGVVKEVAHVVTTVLGAAFEGLSSIFHRVFDPLLDTFHRIGDAIQTVVDLIGKIKVPKIPGLSKILGRSAPAPSVAAAYGTPGLRSAPASTSTRAATGGGGVTVQIFGAVDPQGTARAVQRLLHNADVRTGRRRLA